MSEVLKLGKASVAKHGEVMVKGVIGDIFDPAVLEAKEKLKALIPGDLDNMVIDLIVSNFTPALKAALLAKVDALSPEV